MKTHLHFTFGPVQSFVAQARRTRDLYAGSFLLSHLAMAAMAAVEKLGEVVLPDFASLQKNVRDHASAPNRFIAQFDDEASAAEAGNLAGKALLKAWGRIADAVSHQFFPVSVVTLGHGTQDIWNRQRDNFWEIAWAVGKPEESDLLDRRKNWRTPCMTTEGGDHCTLMGRWQELSGFNRSQQRKQQDDFWLAVRDQPEVKRLNLEEDERLCAIAFIKRFFPLVSKKAVDRELDMQNWPSTVTIAAIPWLRTIKTTNLVHAAATAYADSVRNEPGSMVNSSQHISLTSEFPESAGHFPKLSGNFLNRTTLANRRGTQLRDEACRLGLLKALGEIEELTKDHASNFYALLLMDGDSMGRLIRENRENGAKKVIAGLTKFAISIPDVITKHDGRCVYAGGDDLLAFLPLDRALEAVRAARKLYVNSFEEQNVGSATISAGLVFAHYRCAFSRVVAYAHDLLGNAAKDATGRDALALGVMKPGGITCQWSAKFATFLRDDPNCFEPLVHAFKDGTLTSSFLYNLRERFGEMLETPRGATSENASLTFDPAALQPLFVAEYLIGKREKSPVKSAQQLQSAKNLMGLLITICQCVNPDLPEQPRFNLDGARLVKFLALNGKEGAE